MLVTTEIKRRFFDKEVKTYTVISDPVQIFYLNFVFIYGLIIIWARDGKNYHFLHGLSEKCLGATGSY